uniref:Uncharacterized protein n=1 Tax=Ciona intestinalis TaxID=7719 RepID=H2Y0J8_CIOIN
MIKCRVVLHRVVSSKSQTYTTPTLSRPSSKR